jgi:hypothetical protein
MDYCVIHGNYAINWVLRVLAYVGWQHNTATRIIEKIREDRWGAAAGGRVGELRVNTTLTLIHFRQLNWYFSKYTVFKLEVIFVHPAKNLTYVESRFVTFTTFSCRKVAKSTTRCVWIQCTGMVNNTVGPIAGKGKRDLAMIFGKNTSNKHQFRLSRRL